VWSPRTGATSLVTSGPLTCRLRQADQQDCPAHSVKRPGWTQRAGGRMLPRFHAGDCRCATRSEPNNSSRSPPSSIAPRRLPGQSSCPGGPHPCGLHQDRRGCLRGQGRRAGGAGPRLGGSLLRREMSWVFRRRPDRQQRRAASPSPPMTSWRRRYGAATTDVVIPTESAVRSACVLDATPSQQPLRRQAWRSFGRR
jgi:hypothetical protein